MKDSVDQEVEKLKPRRLRGLYMTPSPTRAEVPATVWYPVVCLSAPVDDKGSQLEVGNSMK